MEEDDSKEYKASLKNAQRDAAKFILFKMQVDNWVRCESFRICTVEDYMNRKPSADNEVSWIKLSGVHKTIATHGPGTFVVTKISERLIDIYLAKIRPTLETERSGDFLFINSRNGKQLQGSNVSTNFKEMWGKCGGKSSVSSHFLKH